MNPTVKTIRIEGMMCAHCTAHVKKALEALEGVSAELDLASGTATVSLRAPVSDAQLTQAVSDAGYTVLSIE